VRTPRETYDRVSAWLLIGLGTLVLLSAGPSLVIAVRDGGWGNAVFVLVLMTIVALGMAHAVRRLRRAGRPRPADDGDRPR
jgi:hypothetical protein